MKDVLMSILRNKETPLQAFREAADKLALMLAIESGAWLNRQMQNIQTPVADAEGVSFHNPVVLVPILRAGLALLPAFLKFYPEAIVGFIGAKRDEETALPKLYYENFPEVTENHTVIILDPMLATGGSILMTIRQLKEHGVQEAQIVVMALIGAPEGVEHLHANTKGVRYNVLQMDEKLTRQKFISPGLGDFGDRYFGC